MGNDGDDPRLEFVAQPISSWTRPDATGKLSPGMQRIAVTDSMLWGGTELFRCGYGDKVLKVHNFLQMLVLNRSLRAGVAALSLSLLASTSAFAGFSGGHAMPSKDIVETAISAGNFKTLTTALEAAGLVETLKGKGPFTVFAPTDEAFAKLPAGTVELLLKPANKQKLTAILTYHVVAGNVKAADVIKLSSAKTVNGQSVTIKTVDGKVLINGSTVVKADIAASNGTIHVIDTVLMPK